MEKIAYGGWPNCIRLANDDIELVVTSDVGPRVMRLAFIGGENLLKEYPEQMGQTGGKEWCIYGGHRLWHAPEQIPRTYWPDNVPVQTEWDGQTLKLIQPIEETTRIQKEIEITLDPLNNVIKLMHRLINLSPWDITLAPWALSVMAAGGRAIFPQEPFIPHEEYLLPARPMVLWHYTVMNDPRWTWGEKFVQLQQDPAMSSKLKLGVLNKQGWAAYALGGTLFIKQFAIAPDAEYPDFGCNMETFTDANMLEIESLGPLTTLFANGGVAEHVERWSLHKTDVGTDEASIAATILPLLNQ